jgi:hypothetical protein
MRETQRDFSQFFDKMGYNDSTGGIKMNEIVIIIMSLVDNLPGTNFVVIFIISKHINNIN